MSDYRKKKLSEYFARQITKSDYASYHVEPDYWSCYEDDDVEINFETATEVQNRILRMQREHEETQRRLAEEAEEKRKAAEALAIKMRQARSYQLLSRHEAEGWIRNDESKISYLAQLEYDTSLWVQFLFREAFESNSREYSSIVSNKQARGIDVKIKAEKTDIIAYRFVNVSFYKPVKSSGEFEI